MQDEPRDNHEGEEDVERNRDRKVWKTEVDDGTVPDTAIRLRCLADERDTHPYIDGVNPEYRCRFVGDVSTHLQSQGTCGRGRR